MAQYEPVSGCRIIRQPGRMIDGSLEFPPEQYGVHMAILFSYPVLRAILAQVAAQCCIYFARCFFIAWLYARVASVAVASVAVEVPDVLSVAVVCVIGSM